MLLLQKIFHPAKVYSSKFFLSTSQFATLLTEKYLRERKMEANLISRPDPVVLKIDSPAFTSIFTKELRDLLDLFKKYDHEVRIAGGAVRDILLEKFPTDIDIATTATPTEMKAIFTENEIRMINMNGEKHGTITPRINDKQNFEITTLRIDVLTDGRHAEVLHTKDWQLDANRRDLTINSMFLGFDGTVYDYFYGYEDLQNRRIAFVGDPDTRIKEDYLRIMRYFRFYGRIAETPDKHDPETLRIIAKNIGGLERISGERIWGELKKTLQGNFASELLLVMLETGIAKYIGLPENPDVEELKKVCRNLKLIGGQHQPITVMSALLNEPEDAIKLNARLKFTVMERETSYFITQNRDAAEKIDNLLYYQQICFQTLGNGKLKKEYVLELLKYLGKVDIYNKMNEWKIPRFPIDGKLIKEHGCPSGIIMGMVFNKLKSIWIEHEFQISAEDLLKHLPEIYEELNIVDGKVIKMDKN